MTNCKINRFIIISNYHALILNGGSILFATSRLMRGWVVTGLMLGLLFISLPGYTQTVYSRHLSPTAGVEYDTATTSGCASCQIINPSNSADTSMSNYATLNVQGGSADKATLRLKLSSQVSAGGKAGITFVRSGSSNPAVLSSISVSTYRNDTLMESKSGGALTSYVVGTSSLRAVEFTTSYDYDAVEIEVRKLGSGVNSMDVYYAYGNNAVPLPVELLNFNANQEKDFVRLRWTTASEYNNAYFSVQKSEDGIHFVDIDNINAYGNSNNTKHYSTVDFSPKEGVNYYRLVQVDQDLNETYSKILKVNYTFKKALPNQVKVYPNPVINNITVSFEEEVTGGEVVVGDMMGNTLYTEQVYAPTKQIKLDLSAFTNGTYIVYVYGLNGKLTGKKLITKY